ncbi:MAG TPA: allophanate hydrolase [Terriglobia bacterium]|nr:allophanate hydrolase [Terriglobia bacterium]
MTTSITLDHLREKFVTGETSPASVIQDIFSRIRAEGERPVWISLVDENQAVEQAASVDLSLPLGGIPFAVKDNFDVAGMATTAGCPSFTYTADRTAPAIQRLINAGAILIGKTNMDQFATGLVGVRSPYGACSSVYDSRYISGGSSSGSAVAVAKGLCAFSLGTDTAGSGRVPAAFNNLIGLKPTRGLLSTNGVVPACRSLDCVSIFARAARDAHILWDVAKGFDADDPYSRTFNPGAGAAPWLISSFRFGVPEDSQFEFFGDEEAPQLYREAIGRLEAVGGERTIIDFTPFREAAKLLYSGPWVAERFAAVGEFLQTQSEGVIEVVKTIILGGSRYSAADAYRSAYRLESLKQLASEEWARMDVLLLPTTGTVYTREAVMSDPIRLNSNLGFYTNFVNLMDLAAVAVPAGFRRDGMPFGVSLIGPAFSDEALLRLAGYYLNECPAGKMAAPGCVLVAVAGAHLSGQPLNYQLSDRRARRVKLCRTAADYRLYALDTVPRKPGLVREPGFQGCGIEVEVWAVPQDQFGSFVAAIPQPLAIGNVTLEDGMVLKGFICDRAELSDAEEITTFGGWRNYLALGRS